MLFMPALSSRPDDPRQNVFVGLAVGRVSKGGAVNEKTKAITTNDVSPRNDVRETYEPTIWLSTHMDNKSVVISVKDNGSGIPKDAIDKIFQPFFTTKPTGKGTGLGLSLSYDIVKAHGGELKVESPPAGRAGEEGEGGQNSLLHYLALNPTLRS